MMLQHAVAMGGVKRRLYFLGPDSAAGISFPSASWGIPECFLRGIGMLDIAASPSRCLDVYAQRPATKCMPARVVLPRVRWRAGAVAVWHIIPIIRNRCGFQGPSEEEAETKISVRSVLCILGTPDIRHYYYDGQQSQFPLIDTIEQHASPTSAHPALLLQLSFRH